MTGVILTMAALLVTEPAGLLHPDPGSVIQDRRRLFSRALWMDVFKDCSVKGLPATAQAPLSKHSALMS